MTAPADGTLLSRAVEPGDVVQPGKALLVLELAAETLLLAQPDEKNLGDLRVGQPALASADAYPGRSFPAQVIYVSPGGDPERGTVDVKLRVPHPPDYLKTDMTLSIDIETARKPGALVVPLDSVRDTATRPWVLVARDGRAERRDITLGLRGGAVAEVLSGVAEGEPGEEPLLLLEGVRRSFGEKVVTEILHGIDLRLDHGEFTALIGPSGSGKTTLLHLLGLLDRPTSGRIVLAGREVSGLSEEERTELRGRTLGFIFQFHHLLPEFTAEENVFMPMLAIRGREEPAMRPRARKLLTAIGLADRMAYRVTDLSGGQQQRVAIARALAMSPALVLADEPTGNLDTETGDQVFALLRQFNREDGTAFLIVTHDPRIAERCDRIIDLVDGRVRSDRRG